MVVGIIDSGDDHSPAQVYPFRLRAGERSNFLGASGRDDAFASSTRSRTLSICNSVAWIQRGVRWPTSSPRPKRKLRGAL